jgi:hypothetical protein
VAAPIETSELENSEAIAGERAEPLAVIKGLVRKRKQPVGRVNSGAEPKPGIRVLKLDPVRVEVNIINVRGGGTGAPSGGNRR